MKTFAGGSLPVSGITLAVPQTCPTEAELLLPDWFALCAAAIRVHDAMTAPHNRDMLFFRFAMFFLLCHHPKWKVRSIADTQAAFADAVNAAEFFLTNSSTLSGRCAVNVSTSSDIRS